MGILENIQTVDSPVGAKVGYARVSTIDQNLDRQIETLKQVGVTRIYAEKISGITKSGSRPQLDAMFTYIREGDTVYVSSFDRLGRDHDDLCQLIQRFRDMKVGVVFIEENLKIGVDGQSSFVDELIIRIFSCFSDFARKQSKERQREGIALAKERGAYKGRQPKLKGDQIEELIKMRLADKASFKEIQEKFSVGRATAWRILNDPKNKPIRDKILLKEYENKVEELKIKI